MRGTTKGKGGETPKELGFYNTDAWQRARQMAKQRDNYLCQACLRNGKVKRAEEVHHLKPTNAYPDLALDMSNLTCLCRECHDKTRHAKPLVTYPARVIKA